MYEKFTARARKVMDLANTEVVRRGEDMVFLHHVFIGLIKEGSGIAANALRDVGLTLEVVEGGLSPLNKGVVVGGDSGDQQKKLPLNDFVTVAIARTTDVARSMGHQYIGTEHMLLGLMSVVSERDNTILFNVMGDVKPSEVTAAVHKYLDRLSGPKQVMEAEGRTEDGLRWPEFKYEPGQTVEIKSGSRPAVVLAQIAERHGVAILTAYQVAWMTDDGQRDVGTLSEVELR